MNLDNLKQATNPYLPSWEYIPDGEPYTFGDRVYVYGSHDKFNGNVYCMLDYVCWSAPVNDLGNWRYEGVIFRKDQDPKNPDLQGNLYAPDVPIGPDGRYYLYYALSNGNHISVAVCDTPAGQYEFYGDVHYENGELLGDRASDEGQFDPGVITENGKTYLYTGFCPLGDKGRHGAFVTVLAEDMLTIIEEPHIIVPSSAYSEGTGFEGHEFFEAPSIRKKNGKYYFIYSSIQFHELCYAMSDSPTEGFEYCGVIVSNGDVGIDSYKPAEMTTMYCANNHGSMEKVGDDWYIFYHRHTNGTNYSRQGCFEKLTFNEDGTIVQAMMTSCGSVANLKGEGYYPTYIACNLFTDEECRYVPWSGWMSDKFPKITQDGGDGDEEIGYVTNMWNSATAGFKFFDCKGVKKIAIYEMGYSNGKMEVRTEWDGPVLCEFPIDYANVVRKLEADIDIPDGVHSLYFTYRGEGWAELRGFELICE